MWALLVIDQAELFRKEKEKCEAARTVAEKLRGELVRYEERDRPAFMNWLNAKFEVRLSEIRETSTRVQEKWLLVKEVEHQMNYDGVSWHQAYRKVLKRRQAEQEELEREKAEDEPEFQEDFFEQFNEGDDSEENNRHERRDREAETPSKRRPRLPEDVKVALKSLYRELARKLHPDVNQNISPRQKELWLEVQAAYEDGDLGQLETLTAMLATETGKLEKEAISFSSLRQVLEEWYKRIKELKSERNRARKDVAWDFCEAVRSETRITKLKRRVARDLDDEMLRAYQQLEELELLIGGWEEAEEEARHQSRYREQDQGRRRSRGRGHRY